MYNNHYLWLFGNSLIGKYNSQTQTRLRENFTQVHSTIGLVDTNTLDDFNNYQDISNSINFGWRTNSTHNSQPYSFWVKNGTGTDSKTEYDYWHVVSGISNKDSSNCTAFLTAQEISIKSGNEEIVGTTGIVVTNINDASFSDISTHWTYRYSDMKFSNSSIYWFVGLVRSPTDKNQIYILGLNVRNGFNMIARATIYDLIRLDFSHIEYYGYNNDTNAGPSWHEENDLVTFKYILETTESLALSQLNIEYSTELDYFYAFVIPTNSDQVRLYVSKSNNIVGEYKYNEIYTIDTKWQDSSLYNVYAATAHPELISFAQQDNDEKKSSDFDNYLVFSYMTNVVNFSRLFYDGEGSTYVPRMIIYQY